MLCLLCCLIIPIPIVLIVAIIWDIRLRRHYNQGVCRYCGGQNEIHHYEMSTIVECKQCRKRKFY